MVVCKKCGLKHLRRTEDKKGFWCSECQAFFPKEAIVIKVDSDKPFPL